MLFVSRTNYLKVPCQHVHYSAAQLGAQSGISQDISFSSSLFSGAQLINMGQASLTSNCHKKHSHTEFQLVLRATHSYNAGTKTFKYHTAC